MQKTLHIVCTTFSRSSCGLGICCCHKTKSARCKWHVDCSCSKCTRFHSWRYKFLSEMCFKAGSSSNSWCRSQSRGWRRGSMTSRWSCWLRVNFRMQSSSFSHFFRGFYLSSILEGKIFFVTCNYLRHANNPFRMGTALLIAGVNSSA